jgi:hypothetical protein
MNSIHLHLNGTIIEVFYEIVGNNVSIKKAIRNGQDVLPMLDKHSMDKLKRQILNQR